MCGRGSQRWFAGWLMRCWRRWAGGCAVMCLVWMRAGLLVSALACCVCCGSGCAALSNRVIIAHPSEQVFRLAEPVRARVFVYQGGQWIRSGNRVEIPAGWTVLYVGPGEGR